VGRDNHPRERQAKKVIRKLGKRRPADRILIVCEGSKTEVNYFDEIRQELKLPTANIRPVYSDYGTSPHQVVNYARDLFINGDIDKGIQPRAFEKVFAVFDRDSHERYFDALNNAQQINLRNDQKEAIEFKAVVSKPNFELWLLLHYEDQHAWIEREVVMRKLKAYLPNYEKGQAGHYGLTKNLKNTAAERASALSDHNSVWSEHELYTGIHELVELLLTLGK